MRLVKSIRTLVLTDGVCAVLAGGGLRCRLTSDDNVERQPHVFSARSEGEEVGSDAPVVARGPRVRTGCARYTLSLYRKETSLLSNTVRFPYRTQCAAEE